MTGFLNLGNDFALDILSDQVSPPFLQGPNGSKWLTAMGQGLDSVRYRSAQAQILHMPGIGDVSNLPYLGNDRLLTQGASETNQAFTTRITGAFDFWQHGGNDWAVLQAILPQIPTPWPAIRIVDDSGRWSYYAAAANTNVPPLEFISSPLNWIWDTTFDAPGNGTTWWRFYVSIDAVLSGWATQLGSWGSTGKLWGDLTIAWGFNNPTALFQAIRNAIGPVKAANSWCRWIIVAFATQTFVPDQVANGIANPNDGNGRWGRVLNHQYVANRLSSARYIDGPA